ncbi:tetratricopeptide repeat protein, partial [bacterium]|nr:tetratricopeptide repeat protein [bacterium]
QLLEGKKPLTVTLHGAGGIGKTALLWQALLRFAPFFELTLAIGLDPLPSLESVLGRVERFLGLPSPCSNDTKERETMVRNVLTSQRTLLGLDNFETLNYALNEKGSDEEKTAKSLHTFFKSLAANGAILCVTSRDKTALGGHIEEIYGLEDAMGGALFYENVSTRKDALNEAGLEKLSAAIGGHPLALRLLAPIFEEQAGLSLEQFIEKLQTFLPKVSDQWTEEKRHASLGACFAFSLDNLPKTEEGQKLQVAVSRLSVFVAYFPQFTAAPVLENKWPENEDEDNAMRSRADNTLHALWERGLLERLTLPLQNENFHLYRLYPALNLFVAERVLPEDMPAIQETHFRAMRQLASRSYPANEGGGIYSNPFMATVARVAMPDMLKAAQLKKDAEASNLLFHLAFLNTHFGDLEEARKLYQQSLQILEGLGDLQGKAVTIGELAKIYETWGDLDKGLELQEEKIAIVKEIGDKHEESIALHQIAGIYVTRGDLDGATNLYQQSLEIKEELGDLKGKSATLHNMAGIFVTRGDLDRAMKLYQQAQEIEERLGDLKGKSATLHQMANIYLARGDLDGAMKLHQQSLEIRENLGDLKEKSGSLHAMAKIYSLQGDLDRAMQLYQQSLEIREKLGDLEGKSSTLHAIADIYVTRGDLDGAMQLYQQSLEIRERLGDLRGKSSTLHAIAGICVTRGDLDRAMKLYGQSLEIVESLGSMQGKSSILYEIASIYAMRGDLDEAMELYQQSLEIKEALGDLKGKAMTLGKMGQSLWESGFHGKAIVSLLSGLMLLVQLKIEPQTQQAMASDLVGMRQEISPEKFDTLWQEEIREPIPEWLSQPPQREQGVTVEQFIASAIQSAREKRPEAEGYFKSAQKMAA